MCEEWRNNPATFYEWAERNGYDDQKQIDRINNDGDYCPENCRFVTCRENNRNRSTTVNLVAFGEKKCIASWAEDERCLCSEDTLKWRIRKGWDAEVAINTPARHRSKSGQKQ